MSERDLGIGDAAGSMERRLDVACALVHAWIAGAPGGSEGAVGGQALALLEELTLPIAVFDAAGRAPRLANGAWRALLGARGGDFARAQVDEVIRTGVAIHLAEVEVEVEAAVALGDRPARCAATLRPLRDPGGATIGVIVLGTLITDEVIARELGMGAIALVWGGPDRGEPDYFNGAWGAYTRDARRFARIYDWREAIHAGDRPSCESAFDEATVRRQPAEVEARLRRADGEYRWHRIRFVIAPASRWYSIATDGVDFRAASARATLLAD